MLRRHVSVIMLMRFPYPAPKACKYTRKTDYSLLLALRINRKKRKREEREKCSAPPSVMVACLLARLKLLLPDHLNLRVKAIEKISKTGARTPAKAARTLRSCLRVGPGKVGLGRDEKSADMQVQSHCSAAHIGTVVLRELLRSERGRLCGLRKTLPLECCPGRFRHLAAHVSVARPDESELRVRSRVCTWLTVHSRRCNSRFVRSRNLRRRALRAE